jgi:hypothetical protein
MMTKRDIETLEQMILSMTERQYSSLLCWLSNGMEGPLWHPPRRNSKTATERRDSPRA